MQRPWCQNRRYVGQPLEILQLGNTAVEARSVLEFYIHGSVHRESNLIIIQQDATYSVYYVSVGSSTCFGC